MKKKLIFGGVILSVFLMASSSIALPIVKWNQHETDVYQTMQSKSNQLKMHSVLYDLKSESTTSESFLENISDLFANLSLKFKVFFILLFRWPTQGLRNVLSYAFVEHDFIRSVFSNLFQDNDDFSLKEKAIILFTLFIRWPIQAIVDIFTYAFIENSFFTSLFSELKEVSTG